MNHHRRTTPWRRRHAAVLVAAWLLAYTLLLATPGPVLAHNIVPATGGGQADAILDSVGFDQKLDTQVPLDIEFQDETGASHKLSDYFGSVPVVLVLSYYNCPNLCPLLYDGLEKSLEQVPLDAGKDFTVLAVSIDPNDTPAIAAEKRAEYVGKYGRDGADAGWRFMVGEHAMIDRLADAVGFRYAYDAAQGEYAHASGLVILTPEGKVSRYIYGIEPEPLDLRLGIVDAGSGKIGSLTDQILLRCYHYDPANGTYDGVIQGVMQIAGFSTVFMLGGLVTYLWWSESSKRADGADNAHDS